jgi:LemA protein
MHYIIPCSIAFALLIVLLVIYFRRSTRRLRRMKNDLDKAWSDIEALFKQESDDLPRLIQTSRSYMPEEKPVLDSVSAARAAYQRAATSEQKAAANAAIRESLKHLFAAAEKHRDLQRNSTFAQLQTRISEIEERISDRCDLYDDEVNRFNARITHFPGNIPARFAGLRLRPLYRVEPAGQAARRK